MWLVEGSEQAREPAPNQSNLEIKEVPDQQCAGVSGDGGGSNDQQASPRPTTACTRSDATWRDLVNVDVGDLMDLFTKGVTKIQVRVPTVKLNSQTPGQSCKPAKLLAPEEHHSPPLVCRTRESGSPEGAQVARKRDHKALFPSGQKILQQKKPKLCGKIIVVPRRIVNEPSNVAQPGFQCRGEAAALKIFPDTNSTIQQNSILCGDTLGTCAEGNRESETHTADKSNSSQALTSVTASNSAHVNAPSGSRKEAAVRQIMADKKQAPTGDNTHNAKHKLSKQNVRGMNKKKEQPVRKEMVKHANRKPSKASRPPRVRSDSSSAENISQILLSLHNQDTSICSTIKQEPSAEETDLVSNHMYDPRESTEPERDGHIPLATCGRPTNRVRSDSRSVEAISEILLQLHDQKPVRGHLCDVSSEAQYFVGKRGAVITEDSGDHCNSPNPVCDASNRFSSLGTSEYHPILKQAGQPCHGPQHNQCVMPPAIRSSECQEQLIEAANSLLFLSAMSSSSPVNAEYLSEYKHSTDSNLSIVVEPQNESKYSLSDNYDVTLAEKGKMKVKHLKKSSKPLKLKKESSTGTVKCPLCDFAIAANGLEAHKKQHRYLSIMCTTCQNLYEDKKAYKKHLKAVHADILFVPTRSRSSKNPRQHACSRCGCVFSNQNLLKKHMVTSCTDNNESSTRMDSFDMKNSAFVSSENNGQLTTAEKNLEFKSETEKSDEKMESQGTFSVKVENLAGRSPNKMAPLINTGCLNDASDSLSKFHDLPTRGIPFTSDVDMHKVTDDITFITAMCPTAPSGEVFSDQTENNNNITQVGVNHEHKISTTPYDKVRTSDGNFSKNDDVDGDQKSESQAMEVDELVSHEDGVEVIPNKVRQLDDSIVTATGSGEALKSVQQDVQTAALTSNEMCMQEPEIYMHNHTPWQNTAQIVSQELVPSKREASKNSTIICVNTKMDPVIDSDGLDEGKVDGMQNVGAHQRLIHPPRDLNKASNDDTTTSITPPQRLFKVSTINKTTQKKSIICYIHNEKQMQGGNPNQEKSSDKTSLRIGESDSIAVIPEKVTDSLTIFGTKSLVPDDCLSSDGGFPDGASVNGNMEAVNGDQSNDELFQMINVPKGDPCMSNHQNKMVINLASRTGLVGGVKACEGTSTVTDSNTDVSPEGTSDKPIVSVFNQLPAKSVVPSVIGGFGSNIKKPPKYTVVIRKISGTNTLSSKTITLSKGQIIRQIKDMPEDTSVVPKVHSPSSEYLTPSIAQRVALPSHHGCEPSDNNPERIYLTASQNFCDSSLKDDGTEHKSHVVESEPPNSSVTSEAVFTGHINAKLKENGSRIIRVRPVGKALPKKIATYQCGVCNQRYRELPVLREHMKGHIKNRANHSQSFFQ